MPVPVSCTRSSARAPAARRVTRMSPSKVNLKAFESRLRTIFSHMSRSTKTGSLNGGQSTRSRRPARSTAARKTLARSAVKAARSVGWKRRPDPTGLDPGEVEQRVDEAQQPQAVAIDELQLARRRRGKIGMTPGEQVLDGTEHQRQRSAEFVADVAEERCLRPVDLGERLGALLLFLVGARVCNGGRELRSKQFEEIAIVLVQPQSRAHSRYQQARRLVRLAGRDRRDDRRLRWIGPGTRRNARKARSEPVHHDHRLAAPRLRQRPADAARFTELDARAD